jgi:RNA polymerase sigma-70 factor, ECF subfamily
VTTDEPALRALFLAGRAGDGAATAAFLKAAAALLRGYFRARLRGGGDDSEDLVQEVLIALHTKADSYDSSLPLTAWMYAIARYRLIDFVRARNRRGVSVEIDDAGDDGALSVRPEAEAGTAKRDVARLLSTLPAKQSAAIKLVKLYDLSIREAAAKLGFSESDIKISIHRGLKSLMRLMGQNHEDGATP